MSISQILSVAARKAAAESGKYISAASALLLVLAVSIGILPNLPQQGQIEVAGQANVPSDPQNAPVPDVQAPLTESQLQASGEPTPVAAAGSIKSQEPVSPEVEEALPNTTLASTTETEETAPVENARPTIRTASLAPYLDLAVQQAEVVKSSTSFFPNATDVIKIHSGVGLWAYVDYEPTTMTINAVAFEVMIDGQPYFASPRSFGAATTESATGYTLTYSATEIFLIDSERNVLSEQDLASAFVTVMLQLNQLGDPIGANLFIQG